MSRSFSRLIIFGDLASPHTVFRAKLLGEIIPLGYMSNVDLPAYKFAYRVWAPRIPSPRIRNFVMSFWVVGRSWISTKERIIFFSCDFRRNTFLLRFCRDYYVVCMGSDLIEPKSDWLYRLINLFLKNSRGIFYKSSNLGQILIDRGFGYKSYQLMWGVEISGKSAGGTKENTLVSHRGCDPFYRNDLIIRAVGHYYRSNSVVNGFKFKILLGNIHDEKHLRDLKELVKSEGIDCCTEFISKLTQREVVELFQASKVAVSMPRSDGFPNSIFETTVAKCWHVLPRFPQYMDVTQVSASLLFVKESFIEISNAIAYGMSHEIKCDFDPLSFNMSEKDRIKTALLGD